MAARIDGLIASHQDMTNAVSHEIKTPLSRMQFEIELAQRAQSASEVKTCSSNIKADIAAINDLVSATLSYAILERADLSLNIGPHNFTTLLPAITEFVQGGMNQLSVDDDGPGIPEQDRQRAFDSFVQLDSTGAKKTGFGLGLAIVKRAIEWHGGEVFIAKSPLGGARVSAAWPIKMVEPGGIEPPSISPTLQDLRT